MGPQAHSGAYWCFFDNQDSAGMAKAGLLIQALHGRKKMSWRHLWNPLESSVSLVFQAETSAGTPSTERRIKIQPSMKMAANAS